MLSSFNRFGGAMLGAVLLFPFAGMVVGISLVLQNSTLFGPDSLFFHLLQIIESGGWTVFNNMGLLFAVGLPIKLATKAPASACLVSLITYLTFNAFLGAMCEVWGSQWGVDFAQDTGGTSGLAMIGGIKTLDTSVIGAILCGSLVTWIHNRFYSTKLPDYVSIFQGAAFVNIIGFSVMLPLALLTLMLWPKVQLGMVSLQGFIIEAGNLGIWCYIFLEKILLPTGLHHFVYSPFQYADVAVPGGTTLYWLTHLQEFSQSSEPLKNLFPAGGFAMQGNGAVFGGLGMALAIYSTAKTENKAKVAGLLIPATVTSMFIGITEPLDFTFLFIAPALFAVHAVLSATMTVVMYSLGVVGNFGAGILEWATQNWIPLFNNHAMVMVTQLVVGLIFSGIYFLIFRTLILKFNFKTLGREDSPIKLYSKQDYKNKGGKPADEFLIRAHAYLEAAGGKDNVASYTHCFTRLRLVVKDSSKVQPSEAFKEYSAIEVYRKGNDVQVIVGNNVTHIYEQFADLMS
ncbi:alpha-glucoside-specific PTS transporter subunit IIBC [Biostraticola tofi]|uniref:PTS system glucose/alpha-glucoside-specific IIB component (Glc family) /PTS system glucose/alpha-glucoside-specific IIC component (Glc family) n=1 Tax=Biostraticola tofi TaxID=466109 RepID=A0A4R3YVT8_9GAMM|nr:alpha-glucoside-specific PTS transporter subunit IIBC [Biostraticola tofi]TCV96771.1 PTS system glucose/alpha-glucoside-specific IIB component (Glc family) /PTS system glucose/alpha-glucoside-specific IIC component (Glc family) [Biostraticola tofi]